MTKYTLFTGATGLLGAYLLRDGMSAGMSFAVLARSSKSETARGRIESILSRFERESGISLPRPVVLEGNLSEPGLGLSREDRNWVARHCDRVLHNAASLIFYNDEQTGEPEKSNVGGTRNVLELVRETGIRIFHHVSTAYVCGLRNDLCKESELDVGQEFGNDYERSKVEAEKMVRSADFLDSVTVHRPAIIIGDSQTGYTSTYHGFFTPLKVVHVFAMNSNMEVIDGKPLLAALGFSGAEKKNFVPVDWVSGVMTHVLKDRKHWDRTYNLVPRNRVTVATSTKVFEDALRRFYDGKAKKPSGGVRLSWEELGKTFRDQMSVYQSYWRDDPVFDDTNTRTVAPHLPCPTVHYAMLMRMSLFALENGFGWPKPQPIAPKIDIEDRFRTRRLLQTAQEAELKSVRHPIGLQINGPGGGQWTIGIENADRPEQMAIRLLPGLPADPGSRV